MSRAIVNGIALEYELTGSADRPLLLMIHGVGAQLTRWPQGLCDGLLAAGFRILRYDSRDIGLSTYQDEAAATGPAYTLSDLAADAAGLLDGLGIAAAHLLGVSLGGMVAQVMAVEYPRLVASLNIMMSQSGNPALPPSDPQALAMLSRPAPDPHTDREAYLDHQIAMNRVLGSPDYPTPEPELRRFAEQAADRAYHPAGAARQLAVSRGAPDRRVSLRGIAVPTLIIHGCEDTLIRPEGGDDLACNIRGAWLVKVNGMGHDLPAALFGLFVAVIGANCARSETPLAAIAAG